MRHAGRIRAAPVAGHENQAWCVTSQSVRVKHFRQSLAVFFVGLGGKLFERIGRIGKRRVPARVIFDLVQNQGHDGILPVRSQLPHPVDGSIKQFAHDEAFIQRTTPSRCTTFKVPTNHSEYKPASAIRQPRGQGTLR